MAKNGTLVPIEIMAGVQPVTDETAVSTDHYTYSDKIRFRNGLPEKEGGNQQISYDYNAQPDGYTRSIYSEYINGKLTYIIGTHKKLYAVVGSTLINITPFETTSVAVANSLTTHYGTLANNPLSAVSGSHFVTITDSDASRLRAGDIVYLSGATGFAGIPSGDFDGDFIVRSVGAGSYTIYVATAATSTASGGGAAVVRSSGLINVDSTAHGLVDGERVSIEGAVDTGGIIAADLNQQFAIRNALTDSFDVMTIGEPTSSVTGGGGTGTEYFPPIQIGEINETNVQGYGAGLYGIGLYGTALTSNSARRYPRIWFDSRYGDTIITTPGEQGGLYQWLGDAASSPALIGNAPEEINYAFVSDNIIVTLGAGGIENRVYACDQNNITEWSSSSVNQVYDDDIEGAGRLISHCPISDYNLLFTEHKVFRFRYIGLPFVWEISEIDDIGLIAPMARVSVKGKAFWMGQENFYMFRGGEVEIIPANSQIECTCLKYVFDNLNWGQKSKFFAWHNPRFNEVWFHYASADSNEPNRVVKVCLDDFSWSIDMYDRTAGEWPSVKTANPLLANIENIYKHELGNDNNGNPLSFTLTSDRKYYGKDTVNMLRIIPDSTQTGEINVNVKGYLFAQSTGPVYDDDYLVTNTTEKIENTNNGRFYQMTISGSELGQSWKMGTWFQEIQKGPAE